MKEVTTDVKEIQRIKETMNNYMPTNQTTYKKMDKFLETKQSSKTESGRNRNLNRLITSKEIKSIIIILKIFQQTKVQDQMASQVNSIKHLEKS